mmetsp:Transcript_24968/g.37735  ORF Transcript_24968/g.37735 Transcript_24968/m.37735 type:complete len:531 (+) Transcript_24968:55-1647(+)
MREQKNAVVAMQHERNVVLLRQCFFNIIQCFIFTFPFLLFIHREVIVLQVDINVDSYLRKNSSGDYTQWQVSTVDDSKNDFVGLSRKQANLFETTETFPAPLISDNRTSSIYSERALESWNKLIQEKVRKGENITLVINGGSSSAGAPNIPFQDRFFVNFAQRLEKELGAVINIIDRAHGARNTVHSAHMATSFLPEELDILIWEFSINDGHRDEDVRNQMRMWLRNVGSWKKPPVVILVYLWKSPFQETSDGKILCRTFDQHDFIGAEYDFVLGHINMASYFDNFLGWNFTSLKSTFLADRHHPNLFFHQVLGKLMFDFIAHSNEYEPTRRGPAVKTDLEWICDGSNFELTEKLEYFFDQTGGVAKASYTPDLPSNEHSHTKMLQPFNYSKRQLESSDVDFKRFAKADETRSDRQRGIILPCCNDSYVSFFNLTRHGHIEGIMLSFRSSDDRKNDARLVINAIEDDIAPDFLRPTDSNCHLGGYNMGIGDFSDLDAEFVLIEQSIDTLQLCDAQCQRDTELPLEAIAIF